MRLQRYQIGASISSIIFIVLVLVFIGHTGFKLIPIYMEDMAIRSVMSSLDGEDGEYSRPADVHQAIFRRLGVNNIRTLGRDDVAVTREGNTLIATVEYEVRVPYIANISLVMDFHHRVEVRAR